MEDSLICNFWSKKVVKIHETYKKLRRHQKGITAAFLMESSKQFTSNTCGHQALAWTFEMIVLKI